MLEQTLVIIKPDGMEHEEEIKNIFLKNGLQILKEEVISLDEELIMEHYGHVSDKPFFPRLKEFMMSKPVKVMILEGNNAIIVVRQLIGKTNSKEAEIGTIRRIYGTDSTMNAVHASDSKENALIEINRFFNREKNKVKIR